jgi:hypothetical protein
MKGRIMPETSENAANQTAEISTGPAAPANELTQVFLKHNSWWHDMDGIVRTAPAHAIVMIPNAIAKIALGTGNALDPKCEVAQKLYAAFGVCWRTLREDECVDLGGTRNPDREPRPLPVYRRPVIHSSYWARWSEGLVRR